MGAAFRAPIQRLAIASAALAVALSTASCAGGTSSPTVPSSSEKTAPAPPLGTAPPLTDGEGAPRTHVATISFYQGVNENTDLPANFMAQNYDWTEQASNAAGAKAASAYHAAGGLHAIAYMDPNGVNCSSDQPGSCTDLETRLDNMAESGYLHNQDGSRAYSDGQQRINTLSSVFLAAWPQQVQDFVGLSPAWTAPEGGLVEIDTENWVTLTSFTYDGGPFQEITQQTQVTQAQSGVPGYTPNNAVLNGVDYDFPANGMYDQLLNVLGSRITGEFNENAFAMNYGSAYMTESYPINNAWSNQENGILDVLSRKLHDYVWMKGDSSPAHRLYGLASYWLTRKGNKSVLWEEFCAPDNTPGGYCNTTWDDGSLLPRNPLQTATSGNIQSLAVGSVYRREFQACFYGGKYIGKCASVVNPSGQAANWPSLTQTYGHTLVLSKTSLYGGGTVSWTTGVPTTVPAAGAAIVAE